MLVYPPAGLIETWDVLKLNQSCVKLVLVVINRNMGCIETTKSSLPRRLRL